MMRMTGGRADPGLARVLAARSYPTMAWMRDRGVRWALAYGRQAFERGGRVRFWGGLIVEAVGGGVGLSDRLFELAGRVGRSRGVRGRGGPPRDRRARRNRRDRAVSPTASGPSEAGGVVLASGGFQADPEMREQLPGPGLGARQGARDPVRHRRRHPHGPRRWRPALRRLGRLPRRRVGPERAPFRRPEDRRPLPEALLPLRHRRGRGRQAVRGRGRGLPQLHLRQVRARDSYAAPRRRLPAIRRQDDRTSCGTSTGFPRCPKPSRTPFPAWPTRSGSTGKG